MRRYVLVQNRRLRGILTNQKKVLNALSELHDPDELFLLMDYRGKNTFLPLNQARLNKQLLQDNRVLVFTAEDIEDGEREESCEELIIASFSIQEATPNIIVDQDGNTIEI